jgi:chemotaxis signal transduction protein
MDTITRRLLFRIGTVGFCLSLGGLIEILEQVDSLIDRRQVDPQLSVVGALSFRRTMIPIVDLAGQLGIPSVSPDTALVLSSREGNWALLVDRVEGFYSATEMIDLPVPRLLQAEGWRCFDQIALYAGTPYLRLNLPECYSGVGR